MSTGRHAGGACSRFESGDPTAPEQNDCDPHSAAIPALHPALTGKKKEKGLRKTRRMFYLGQKPLQVINDDNIFFMVVVLGPPRTRPLASCQLKDILIDANSRAIAISPSAHLALRARAALHAVPQPETGSRVAPIANKAIE